MEEKVLLKLLRAVGLMACGAYFFVDSVAGVCFDWLRVLVALAVIGFGVSEFWDLVEGLI